MNAGKFKTSINLPPDELKGKNNIYESFLMSLAEFVICVLILYTLYVHITNDCNYKARVWVVHFAQRP